MLRRSLVVVAVLAAALSVAPFAAAAVVHIRVEGKTLTIFGATEPRVSAATPLEALQAAARAARVLRHVTASSFGNYVDQVGLYGGSGSEGWVFKVNGVSPPVGADQVQLKDGDVVEWYYAAFGATGGPPTLVAEAGGEGLLRRDRPGRHRRAKVPSGLVYHIGARTIPAAGGTHLLDEAARARLGERARHRPLEPPAAIR